MKYCFFLILLFSFTFFISPFSVGARTIHVHPDSVVTRIQDGINIAEHGDTVMVFPGTYFEYRIDFLGKAITVMSTDPFDAEVVASTVVNANSEGAVFRFQNGEDTTSVLAGFTITGGDAPQGGGIRCDYTSPTIAWNIITGNLAGGGAGICFCYGSPIITNNVISNNSVVNEWSGGGGILCSMATGRITNNVIRDNSGAPGDWGYGGGIWCSDGAGPLISGNTITGNISDFGGGISVIVDSNCEITNTILWGNEGGGQGDEIFIGIYDFPSTVTISYSDVEGGLSSVFYGDGCILNWGEGMVDIPPLFELNGSGYHLQNGSPLKNIGDPNYIASEGERDIDGNARVLEGRIDIGADEIRVMNIEDDDPPVIIDSRNQAKSLE